MFVLLGTPHELMENQHIRETITQKYLRRYHRLHKAFESGNDIVFLTVLPHVVDGADYIFTKIKEKLVSDVVGKCTFFTINLNDTNSLDQQEDWVHINCYVPLNGNWDEFDNTTANSMRTILKHRF
ncbi:MAG: hypothetical protein EXR21_09145 [Flavobacteriaceae bacterium]|nr:hypothetical protein [Flavobacteriaceae bacterium]